MNENNSKVVTTNETDYQETKGECIIRLLWWLIGLTAARLVFHIYELTGGYVPVPNFGNQAVYLLISAVATVILISLGKYGKFYKISGILAAVSCVTKLILPFAWDIFSNPESFLDYISQPKHPIYRLLSTASTYLPIVASVLVGIAHMKFSKPLNEKISKGWKIALIAYIAIFVIEQLYITFRLFFNPDNADFLSMINNIRIGLSEAVILAEYAFQIVLLYFMAKKSKEIK